jgi:hypothetical protein
MLTKDYRSRATLDQIIVDDWVTFEGSEPLFEPEIYFYEEFIDYEGFLDCQDEPNELAEESIDHPFRILITHPSSVIRRMLYYQFNTLNQSMCCCAGNMSDFIRIMDAAMKFPIKDNFDFLFIDIQLPDLESQFSYLQSLRSRGFIGKMIGMYSGPGDIPCSIDPEKIVFNVILNRPMAIRDLALIFTRKSSSIQEDLQTFDRSNPLIQEHRRISAEEYESAITTSIHNHQVDEEDGNIIAAAAHNRAIALLLQSSGRSLNLDQIGVPNIEDPATMNNNSKSGKGFDVSSYSLSIVLLTILLLSLISIQ